jgi:methyl-accepting chemotaxis protein
MDEYSRTLINVNTAEQSELVTIPGVGRATARKIIAARPFASLDDLVKVGGINADMLERIKPYLQNIPGQEPSRTADKTKKAVPSKKSGTKEPAPAPSGGESQAVSKSEAPAADGEESIPEKVGAFLTSQPEKLKDFLEDQPENFEKIKDFIADQPEKLKDFLDDQPENLKKAKEFIASQPEKIKDFLDDQPEKFEKVKASTGMSNANLITLLTACLITMVVTLLLTIGLLGAINGGLRYSSQNEFAALTRQVESSTSKLDMLEKDTDSIRARLDALESMSGRMKLIEEENAAIRKQLEESSRQVSEVKAQLEQTRADIDRLKTSADFFDRFIAGLRTLLNETTQP